jgi:hypothetical protein
VVALAARTSSTEILGALSCRTKPSGVGSITASSVTIRVTGRRDVAGNVNSSTIFGVPPPWVWFIATTTRFAPLTRSIAPPMPGTRRPGIIHQYAKFTDFYQSQANDYARWLMRYSPYPYRLYTVALAPAILSATNPTAYENRKRGEDFWGSFDDGQR